MWWKKIVSWMQEQDKKIISKWEKKYDLKYDYYFNDQYYLNLNTIPPKLWIKIIYDRTYNKEYMIRHYLINLSPLFKIVIHNFKQSDPDGALHDHPWLFWGTYILEGGYWEHHEKGKTFMNKGSVRFHGPTFLHRVELDPNIKETWTLFFMGPKIRKWGFVKNNTKEWIPQEQYLKN